MADKREAVIETLFEGMNVFKRALIQHMQEFMQDIPLSRSHLELLVAIKHEQPVSAKQLAATLHLSPGGVSQIVEALVAKSFIDQRNTEDDRRSRQLSLSKQGSKLLKDMEKRRRAVLRDAMETLTIEELEAWSNAQSKLTAHFQSINQSIAQTKRS